MKYLVDRLTVLNLAETAKRLRVSKTTVKNWIDDGAPARKSRSGHDWDLRPRELLEWKRECAIDKRLGGSGKLDFSRDLEDAQFFPGEIEPAKLREAAKALEKRLPEQAAWLALLADYLDPAVSFRI